MEELFYLATSSSLTLVKDNSNYTIWNNVTNLTSSVIVSGGPNRILAYSGSTLIASFPTETTAIYYPPFPNSSANIISTNIPTPIPTSSNYNNVLWNLNIEIDTSGSSGCSIFDTTLSSYNLSQSVNSNSGMVSILSGDTFLLRAFGSGSYTSSISITDSTLGSVLFSSYSIDTPISTSFNPVAFHSYNIEFRITGSVFLP
jgi:hypothetical protein